MPRVKQHTAWKWYASFKDKRDLDLPDIAAEANGQFRIHCDELFCRAPGCPKNTPETSLNNLRKHYARKHSDIPLTGPISGGRPSLAEETASIAFYKAIREAYDSRPVDKPELPIKEDRTVHLTNARRIVREAGGQVPCEPCKDAGDPTGCVRLENQDRCENFEFFADGDEEDEDEVQGGAAPAGEVDEA